MFSTFVTLSSTGSGGTFSNAATTSQAPTVMGNLFKHHYILMDNTNDTIFTDIESPEIEATYWQKHAFSLIDAAISISIVFALLKLLPNDLIVKLTISVSSTVWILITLVLYRLVTTLIIGRTIGMLLCRVKYLNAEMKELSLGQKLSTVIFILLNDIKYYKVK